MAWLERACRPRDLCRRGAGAGCRGVALVPCPPRPGGLRRRVSWSCVGEFWALVDGLPGARAGAAQAEEGS
ncbi:MAG: hypothetical protein D6809_00980 [Gammaproteobacteria bacterium]|nr:MAG: hypothetical protein D6809_00980 [Gammaproteobacteria bacterium]